MRRSDAHPYALRSVNPSAWPQYPYDEAPRTPERSRPVYEIYNEWDVELGMRDGVRLLLDIYRPRRPGWRFPALCSFSPYSRQLQRDSAPIGQNEAGITEFWVPHGYAHVVVDVRGTNGAGGDWDMWGPEEQRDLAEVIEWVAAQPWCTGSVGMTGCSYFAMTQNLAAAQQPPSLKAIFPYDALTDVYRDAFFPGGIPSDWARFWFTQVSYINSASGRNPNLAGLQRHFDAVFGLQHPFDGPYYRERSARPGLPAVRIPAYFGCDWNFHALHLSGAFDGWRRTGSAVKRLLIGPRTYPVRPFAAYHQEARRWYDLHLKGMDSGVLDGDPVRLWIRGGEGWRGEKEWPLARTVFRDLYLAGAGGGSLLDVPPAPGEARLDYDPAADAWLFGLPKLVFRSEPLAAPMEVTGPVQATLVVASTAEDTDWIVVLQDEAPDGGVQELTRGYLRSSHRAVDRAQSLPNEPWHPHEGREPLTPGEPAELEIGVVPTCNVFAAGHRIRLEISNCDSTVRPGAMTGYRKVLRIPARNTVLTGPKGSRVSLPVIPR